MVIVVEAVITAHFSGPVTAEVAIFWSRASRVMPAREISGDAGTAGA